VNGLITVGSNDYDVLASVDYGGGTRVSCNGQDHNDYTVLNAYCRYYMGTGWYALQRPCTTAGSRSSAAMLTASGQFMTITSGPVLQLPVLCYQLC
jgi:hypothetical protein